MGDIPVLSDVGADRWSIDDAFAVFESQDSGCRSYGITDGGRRWFVKTAQTPEGAASLESAIRFHHAVRHAAILHPAAAGRSPVPTLVYPWVDGVVLNHATTGGSDRRGLARFRRLPVTEVRAALRSILDAHREVTERGFVAVDFYDGAMLYEFAAGTMWLIDLDEYRPGPFRVDVDRLPGSLSYMAPEEFERNAIIDERTTVFVLGRAILHLLTGNDGTWRGSAAERDVASRATATEPSHRYASVALLAGALAAP